MRWKLRWGVRNRRRPGHGYHLAARITQIPGKPIGVAVGMTRSARNSTVSGKPGILEKAATVANHRRSRIECADRKFVNYGVGRYVDDADGVTDPIQNIKAPVRRVQRQPSWAAFAPGTGRAGPQVDPRQHRSIAIDPGNPVAAKRCHVGRGPRRIEY